MVSNFVFFEMYAVYYPNNNFKKSLKYKNSDFVMKFLRIHQPFSKQLRRFR